MVVRVECYSGYKAEERPVRFRLDGQDHMVEEVLDQWHSPDASYFKVRSDDGNTCPMGGIAARQGRGSLLVAWPG